MVSLECFRERLKAVRKEKGFSVDQLGEKISMTGATISRYETGVHEPKSRAIARLADVLGVSEVWLMGGDVEKYTVRESGVEYKTYKKIPILGVISAGQPILAQEHIEGYEYTNNDCAFCLKVKGDSMVGARIFEGDIAYVREQPDVESGEIAAVLIGEEDATLKRVYKKDGAIILHAENPMYPDKVFTKKDFKEVKILGKVKYIKFKAR